jgi:4-aminobutyrate aminotransferase-like enzyme
MGPNVSDAGACEAVAKALQKYNENETVACACFRAIVVFSACGQMGLQVRLVPPWILNAALFYGLF